MLEKAQLPVNNEILLEVNAMFNENADSYLAIFHLDQVGANAREADSLMNQRINNFRKDVSKIGISEDDFIIDMLSMLPVYEVEVTKKLFSKSYTEIPAGFEIQKNIHVRFKNPQVLDKIITSAAINEIYDLVKVDYYVKNVEAIYDSLRAQATRLVLKREAQLKALGINVEGQWRIAGDKIGVYFPLDRYTTYQSNSSISIDAAKKKGTVTQIKRPNTLFYNKIPYTGYDIINNPEIVEPAVQYTYNLQVKFTMERKPEKVEPVKEIKTEYRYMIITPDGVVKDLPIK